MFGINFVWDFINLISYCSLFFLLYHFIIIKLTKITPAEPKIQIHMDMDLKRKGEKNNTK